MSSLVSACCDTAQAKAVKVHCKCDFDREEERLLAWTFVQSVQWFGPVSQQIESVKDVMLIMIIMQVDVATDSLIGVSEFDFQPKTVVELGEQLQMLRTEWVFFPLSEKIYSKT